MSPSVTFICQSRYMQKNRRDSYQQAFAILFWEGWCPQRLSSGYHCRGRSHQAVKRVKGFYPVCCHLGQIGNDVIRNKESLTLCGHLRNTDDYENFQNIESIFVIDLTSDMSECHMAHENRGGNDNTVHKCI